MIRLPINILNGADSCTIKSIKIWMQIFAIYALKTIYLHIFFNIFNIKKCLEMFVMLRRGKQLLKM